MSTRQLIKKVREGIEAYENRAYLSGYESALDERKHEIQALQEALADRNLQIRALSRNAYDQAPKTAQEALDLAWRLAHPVQEGQVIPANAETITVSDASMHKSSEGRIRVIEEGEVGIVRTLDPLPIDDEEEAGWLDAPAVLAAVDECSWQKVWTPNEDGTWTCSCCGETKHWMELADIVPLRREDYIVANMAWDSAHVLESGDIIPGGTKVVYEVESEVAVDSKLAGVLRTIEPLPASAEAEEPREAGSLYDPLRHRTHSFRYDKPWGTKLGGDPA